MISTFLFPNHYRKIGWVMFACCFVLGTINAYNTLEPDFLNWTVFAIGSEDFFTDFEWFSFVENNVFDELLIIISIVSLMFIAFSREKLEDEYTMSIRLNALSWAVYFNYLALIFAMVFFYGMVVLDILLFNLIAILVIFIVRYQYLIYKNRKVLAYEE